jgi:hypothetical protein
MPSFVGTRLSCKAYKIPVHLVAGASTMFDAGDLIAMQEPDSDGHTIPPYVLHGTAVLSAASGGAEVINVAAEVGVFNVTNATCGDMCPNCLGYSGGYRVQNDSGPVAVGQTASFSAWALRQDGVWVNVSCNHPSEEASTLWTSSNNSVAQPSSCGNFTTNSPGTFTATAESTLIDWPADCPEGRGHLCPTNEFGPGGAGGGVMPHISGPNTVWWFNGLNPDPTAYPIAITLSSDGGAATQWAVGQADNKVTLSATSGAQITVTSTGAHFSTAVGDINITATANGSPPSAPLFVTSRKPASLGNPRVSTRCDAQWGYESDISYIIYDQLDQGLPHDVDWNENWTTGVTQVYAGTNWPQNPAQGTTALYYAPSGGPILIDGITGPGVNNQPANVPQPTCNANPSVEVVKWGQRFLVGSQTSGAGVQVQQDTLHKWIDHGAHTIP